MLTHNLGYPRIGSRRELKKALEQYWRGALSADQLHATAAELRRANWQVQQHAGIDLIPCGDFSLYDHVLDTSIAIGAIPPRYRPLQARGTSALDVYFAMARGLQRDGLDLTALEMTKWFDTNYHYLVPEFTQDQTFTPDFTKLLGEFAEVQALGIHAKPVLLGPVSYLLLGKEKHPGFHRLDLLERLLPAYAQVVRELVELGADYLQLDEPCLVMEPDHRARDAWLQAYQALSGAAPGLKLLLATYFEGVQQHAEWIARLPVAVLHIDLVRAPEQLPAVLEALPSSTALSLGVVNGRNVWKTDYQRALELISIAVERLGEARVWLAPSCSLLHAPCDLEQEGTHPGMPATLNTWLAFARQKLEEVVTLAQLAMPASHQAAAAKLAANLVDMESRAHSSLIHNPAVQSRLADVDAAALQRHSPFPVRQTQQQVALGLPMLPTTTIGSFPQTEEIRRLRADWRSGKVDQDAYQTAIREQIRQCIRRQEEIGLDVLVHGEFERTDMVEYFGELLDGFAFTRHGWVQSYGSRCVKPPILFGDVARKGPMTVDWARYAQSLTERPVKGMLTGPITLLQWSFVRDDQPRASTALQLALAIRGEVADLEAAGIRIIQIDEPALREGLPLRHADWAGYLDWAVKAFRLAASGVADRTQIHTHMCYSEFNDIMPAIVALDADVITIETSRSQLELLNAFAECAYPNEIGPGVYDIHSPRVPSSAEMVALLQRLAQAIPPQSLWVNPDCGLKTRGWPETDAALRNMVVAARTARAGIAG